MPVLIPPKRRSSDVWTTAKVGLSVAAVIFGLSHFDAFTKMQLGSMFWFASVIFLGSSAFYFVILFLAHGINAPM